MSLTQEWDDELHRAEAVLTDDTRRHGHLVLLPEPVLDVDAEAERAGEAPPG